MRQRGPGLPGEAEGWGGGRGLSPGAGTQGMLLCPQFSIGSDEDDSPGLSGRAAVTKPLPSVGPCSDKSPQQSARYWPPAQPRAGPRLPSDPGDCPQL